jgi:hypothetical protein
MSKDNKKKAENIVENVADNITEKDIKVMLDRIKAKEKEEDKPDLFKEINGVSYVLEEHADEMVDMELARQLWEHIELVSKKLNISEEEAGKIFDIDNKEELMSLKFHAFMMDNIEQTAEDVIKKYAKKQAVAKKKSGAKKTIAGKKTKAKKTETEEKKTEAKPKKETKAKAETKIKADKKEVKEEKKEAKKEDKAAKKTKKIEKTEKVTKADKVEKKAKTEGKSETTKVEKPKKSKKTEKAE